MWNENFKDAPKNRPILIANKNDEDGSIEICSARYIYNHFGKSYCYCDFMGNPIKHLWCWSEIDLEGVDERFINPSNSWTIRQGMRSKNKKEFMDAIKDMVVPKKEVEYVLNWLYPEG